MNHERSYNHSKEQLPNRISGPVPNRCDSVDGMVLFQQSSAWQDRCFGRGHLCRLPRRRGGGGKIAVTSSAGTQYQPGVKHHLKVTVTDPSANAWGYEMTSVLVSKPTTGTGVFKAVDKLSDVAKQGTKSYARQFSDQQGKTKHVTFAIDWIPPKKNAGKITLYILRALQGTLGTTPSIRAV